MSGPRASKAQGTGPENSLLCRFPHAAAAHCSRINGRQVRECPVQAPVSVFIAYFLMSHFMAEGLKTLGQQTDSMNTKSPARVRDLLAGFSSPAAGCGFKCFLFF